MSNAGYKAENPEESISLELGPCAEHIDLQTHKEIKRGRMMFGAYHVGPSSPVSRQHLVERTVDQLRSHQKPVQTQIR